MLFHQRGFSALASALFLIAAPTFAADFITAPLEPIPKDLVAQFAMPDQQRDALIDKAHKLVAAFLEKPNAGTSAALEEIFVELRKPENLKAINRVPLDMVYLRLSHPRIPADRGGTAVEYKARLELLKQWQTLQPKSTAARIARAIAFTEYAMLLWDKFTGVAEDDWPRVTERLAQATAELDAAAELGNMDVHYYAARINIANALGDDPVKVFDWLKAGMKISPTYRALYGTTSNYVMPHWHGEWGDIEVFTTKIYDYLGGGPEAKLAFFYIVDNVQHLYPDYVHTRKYDPNKLREAFATAAHFHDIDQRDGLFQEYGSYVAWLTQDVELAKVMNAQWKDLTSRGDPVKNAVACMGQTGRSDLGDRHVFTLNRYQPKDVEFNADGKTFAIATGREASNPIIYYEVPSLKTSSSIGAQPYANVFVRRFGDNGERTLMCFQNEVSSQFISFIEDRVGTTVNFEGADQPYLKVAIAPDSKTIAAVAQRTGKTFLFDAATGKRVAEFKTSNSLNGLFFTPDSKKLVAARHGVLQFIDLETKEAVAKIDPKEHLKEQKDWLFRGAVGYDFQKRLVIRAWQDKQESWAFLDLETKKIEPIAGQPFAHISCSRLSHDGQHLIVVGQVANGQQLVVIDLEKKQQILNREVTNGQVVAADLSPDRKTVACADAALVLRMYDVPEVKPGK